jgi:O-Antigen ligase
MSDAAGWGRDRGAAVLPRPGAPSALRPALRLHGLRAGAGAAAIWLVPVLIIGLIYFSPKHIVSVSTAVTGLVAFCAVVIAARWPDRSLILLIVLLPFSGFILAKLWAWGVPTSVVRHLGAWKEALALGVIVAGARNFIASGRRADALDRLALGFVGIALLYLALQHQIIPSAPSASSTRLLGFREDAGFVLLLLGARHARLSSNFLQRAGTALLVVASAAAAIGLYEALASGAWNRFVVNTIQYTRYEVSVLNSTPVNFHDIRQYGPIAGVVRIGSVFLSPLTLGFYLVLGFAVGLERVARGRGRPLVMISLLAIFAAILLTQTRSAIIAAIVVAALVLQPTPGRQRHWRAQLALILAAVAVIAIPTAFASGLNSRVASGTSTANSDTAGHVSGFWDGINAIGQDPLGHGLGTSAGVGQRGASPNSQAIIPENYYLQVGVELGIIPMLLFIVLTVTLIVKLRSVGRGQSHYTVAALGGAVAGLAAAAWFLHVWTDFSVAWSVWGLAGAALAVSRERALAAGTVASGSPPTATVSRGPSPAAT